MHIYVSVRILIRSLHSTLAATLINVYKVVNVLFRDLNSENERVDWRQGAPHRMGAYMNT